MKTKVLLCMLIAAVFVITSCSKYPPDVTRTQEDLAVITKYDISKDFTNYHTFWISDSIFYKDGKDSGYLFNATTALVVNQIVKNMTDRGYLRVYRPVKPDLGFGVTLIKNTNVSVYYPYYPYWGWWGYYSYGWYGYQPYVTSYSVGTVIVDLVDVKNPTNNQLTEVWSAIIRGLYTTNHSSAQIQQSVDYAFKQSLCFTTN
ncbi:MAG: DUF4136 domain-containing protein [Bacteroidota bacterium]